MLKAQASHWGLSPIAWISILLRQTDKKSTRSVLLHREEPFLTKSFIYYASLAENRSSPNGQAYRFYKFRRMDCYWKLPAKKEPSGPHSERGHLRELYTILTSMRRIQPLSSLVILPPLQRNFFSDSSVRTRIPILSTNTNKLHLEDYCFIQLMLQNMSKTISFL